MTRDDETPVEIPKPRAVAVEVIEHLCYVDPKVDTVRIWRDGLADDCAICKERKPS